jgi:hypothetical protein
MEHDTAAETPSAALLLQFAFVAAGWEPAARAVAGDQYQQVASGARLLGDLAIRRRSASTVVSA